MLSTDLLRGDLVRLTALTRQDAAPIAAWYQDAEFMRLYGAETAFPKVEEDIAERIERARQNAYNFAFGVRRLDDDVLVGMAELSDVSWSNGNAWLSLAIGKPFWSHRLGSEALPLLLGYAFRELNLHRVQLTVFSYNERALALYRHVGFSHEGTFREHLCRDGQRYDMLLMGILRCEWETLHVQALTASGGVGREQGDTKGEG